MCKRYYSTHKDMRATALSYSQDYYKVAFHSTSCDCGKETTGFTISDRKNGEIIEKMTLCDTCHQKQTLTSKQI